MPGILLVTLLFMWTGKYFFICCFGLTALFLFTADFLQQLLCGRCEETASEMPEEYNELRGKIEDLCAKCDFANKEILLTESQTGDLHSNATLYRG